MANRHNQWVLQDRLTNLSFTIRKATSILMWLFIYQEAFPKYKNHPANKNIFHGGLLEALRVN
jgi:hypothetical protein